MSMLACMLLLLGAQTPPVPPTAGAGTGTAAGTADPIELWAAANNAFRAGQYDTAAGTYRQLLACGVDDAEVYYNLGNAEMRRGQIAPAIAAFRAAQKRSPRDEDIAANLRLARTQLQDAVAPPEPSPILRTLFFWHYVLAPNELALAGLIANTAFWSVLLLAWRWRTMHSLRWLALTFGLTVAALVPSFVLRVWRPTTVAVVHRALLDVYSGPSTATVLRFRLHEGTEVTVTGSDEGWLRISLNDGKQGWVSAGDVITVQL